MNWKAGVFSLTVALCAGGVVTPWAAGPVYAQDAPATGNCLPGDKIDGSTAEQAKAKFEAAGYTEVKIIRKGCDNFWHGSGVYGSVPGFMVLSPDGKVMPEGS